VNFTQWLAEECATSSFADLRLKRRFGKLVAQLARGVGAPIPLACEDWASTKAAYRFFANPRVSETAILAGHQTSHPAATGRLCRHGVNPA
jgi:hypothetical protein